MKWVSHYSKQDPYNYTRIFNNKMTFRKPLGNLRISAGCQGNQPSDQRIGTFSPSPTPGKGQRY